MNKNEAHKSENPMTPDFGKRYVVRFIIGMVSYMILLIVALFVSRAMAEGPARVLLGLLPIPAILFIAWAAVRFSREADELARRQLTESLSIGFFVGSALVASYGLLDSFGAPTLSWMWAFATYMLCWAIGSAIVSRRYR